MFLIKNLLFLKFYKNQFYKNQFYKNQFKINLKFIILKNLRFILIFFIFYLILIILANLLIQAMPFHTEKSQTSLLFIYFLKWLIKLMAYEIVIIYN